MAVRSPEGWLPPTSSSRTFGGEQGVGVGAIDDHADPSRPSAAGRFPPAIKASASDTSLLKALVRKQHLPTLRSSTPGVVEEQGRSGSAGSDPASSTGGGRNSKNSKNSSSTLNFWKTPLVKLKGVSSRSPFSRKALEVMPGKFTNFGEYVHFQRTKPVGKGFRTIGKSDALAEMAQGQTEGTAEGALTAGTTTTTKTKTTTTGVAGEQQGGSSLEQQAEDDEESLDSEEEGRLMEDSVRALHKAALANDAKQIRFLLCGPDARRVLPSPDLCLADDISRATPALKAARAGCAAAVTALLDAKADPLVRDDSPRYFGDGVWPDERRPDSYGSIVPKDRRDEGALPGRTVIYWLRLTGKFQEVVENLFPITRVGLVRSITSGVQEHHGDPALLVAARDGLPDLVALIVNHTAVGLPPLVGPSVGATYNVAMNSWPGSPSTSAAAAMPMAFAGFSSGGGLVPANGASTGSSWSSPCKSTTRERSHALLAACVSKEWKVALVLLGSGVPPSHMSSTKDRLGRTALHIAASNGATEVVKALVRAGHPVRNVSYRGRQPIHEACYAGHSGCVVALLDGRADPAAVAEEDSSGSGRLIASSSSSSAAAANVAGDPCTGLTALEVAKQRGHSELAKLLLQHQGANGGIIRSSSITLCRA